MPGRSRISPIGDIIKSVFAELENKKNLSREDIELFWKEIVGQDGFRHSRPLVIRKEILTVLVDNSVWMQEFTMKKRNILKGLKRRLGKDKISELHFKIGEF